MDARQQKSRAALARAVIELATERPAGELTASAIAQRAGVHRSTFYEHAASPIDLLQSVLREELDELRDRYLTGVDLEDVPAAVRAVTEAVLGTVAERSAIYARGLGEGSGAASLHAMLSGQFQSSTRLLIDSGAVEIPFADVGISEETMRRTVETYVADGTVGAIAVWLSTPAPRNTAAFLDIFALMVPSWFPLAGKASVPAAR